MLVYYDDKFIITNREIYWRAGSITVDTIRYVAATDRFIVVATGKYCYIFSRTCVSYTMFCDTGIDVISASDKTLFMTFKNDHGIVVSFGSNKIRCFGLPPNVSGKIIPKYWTASGMFEKGLSKAFADITVLYE